MADPSSTNTIFVRDRYVGPPSNDSMVEIRRSPSVIPSAPVYFGMADTKEGRDKQARDTEKRQRQRELKEARERGDEAEPPRDVPEILDEALREVSPSQESSRTCHRRGCDEPATFVVVERYQEETGHGAVVAEAFLCRDHTTEEGPANLDRAYPDYVFCVVPIPETDTPDTA